MSKSLFGVRLVFLLLVFAGCSPAVQPTVAVPPAGATAQPVSPSAESPKTPPPSPVPSTPPPTPLSTALPTSTVPVGGTVVMDAAAAPLVAQAKQALAAELNVPADSIQVVSVQPSEWGNAALGCPKPGVMYIQVVTSGYIIVLEANGQQYEYHAGGGRVVRCPP